MTVSGLAASIRAATESETFDLAGNAASTIKTTINDAFSSPLDITEMIRITFVTGAGKLGRSRYDENAAKTVTSTLRELGYEEDRGASCVNECGGSFKSQHDTGKNLKTIVVFPMMKSIEEGMGNMNIGGGGSGGDGSQPLLEEGTPKSFIAMASINTFHKMVQVKCASWSQKKACIGVLGEIKSVVESLDQKLVTGNPLNDSEQEFYDQCDLSGIEQKEQHVRSEMQKQVEEGKITNYDKKRLLTQVKERLTNLDSDIADATKNKKPKKLEKLKMQRGKVTEREKNLDNITPLPPIPLRFQADIDKLRKEMQPLTKMEQAAKGRLLTLKETAAMTRKEEIEEEIIDFEEASRGWFEEDEDFQTRVDASRAQGKARAKAIAARKTKKVSSGGGSGGSSRKPVTNWVLPGASKKTSRPAAAKKKKSASVNTFAAMMMDSDSDSD